jgi:hypothetical protein
LMIVRVIDWQSGGREFDPRQLHQNLFQNHIPTIKLKMTVRHPHFLVAHGGAFLYQPP